MAIITPLKKIFNWQTASEKIPKIPYKVFSFQTIWDGDTVYMSELCENTFSDLGLTYTFVSQPINHQFYVEFSQPLVDFGNKILVFCNAAIPIDNSYQVKANYSYEENQRFYGYGFYNNTGSNIAFSDTDGFSRASFEIRIYQ